MSLDKKLDSSGKTPWDSVSAQLSVNKRRENSKFTIINERPNRYGLKTKQGHYNSTPLAPKIIQEILSANEISTNYYPTLFIRMRIFPVAQKQ